MREKKCVAWLSGIALEAIRLQRCPASISECSGSGRRWNMEGKVPNQRTGLLDAINNNVRLRLSKWTIIHFIWMAFFCATSLKGKRTPHVYGMSIDIINIRNWCTCWFLRGFISNWFWPDFTTCMHLTQSSPQMNYCLFWHFSASFLPICFFTHVLTLQITFIIYRRMKLIIVVRCF